MVTFTVLSREDALVLKLVRRTRLQPCRTMIKKKKMIIVIISNLFFYGSLVNGNIYCVLTFLYLYISPGFLSGDSEKYCSNIVMIEARGLRG